MAKPVGTQHVLQSLQMPPDLAILRLTDPVYATQLDDQEAHHRISNASSTTSNPSHDPRVLKTDLQHYRDLFSKLRFSYVEQVTKEKFLRAVTAEPPELVDQGENIRLIEENKQSKQRLGEKKEELHGMLSDLEAQGRELARRYGEIQLRTTQLQAIPLELEELQARITKLSAAQPQSQDPEQRLPLRETLALLAQKERDTLTVDARIASLRSSLPQKEREIQLLREDLEPLEMRKETALGLLDRMKAEQHDKAADNTEIQLRWLQSVEAGMRAMLAT